MARRCHMCSSSEQLPLLLHQLQSAESSGTSSVCHLPPSYQEEGGGRRMISHPCGGATINVDSVAFGIEVICKQPARYTFADIYEGIHLLNTKAV